MPKIKVLITGASGNVGIELLKQMVEQTDLFDITAFDLNKPEIIKKLSPYKNSARLEFGDITNQDDVNRVCKDKDYVAHLAALIPPKADELPNLAKKINVDGTRNIVYGLEKFSPNAFLGYSSSVSVYGDRVKNPNINVSDQINPSPEDYYAPTKIAAEKIIRDSSLKWTIFRLSAIMGAQNHKISSLMFHMPLDTSVEITTPEDTARAFKNAIFHQDELNKKVFNLGGGEKNRIIFRDLLKENFKLFGLGKFDLPEKAFAEKNFHCGYYEDGNTLENILHFRQDTIDSYLKNVKGSIPSIQRLVTKLVAPIVKKILLTKSEPWKAYKTNDLERMKHFFYL